VGAGRGTRKRKDTYVGQDAGEGKENVGVRNRGRKTRKIGSGSDGHWGGGAGVGCGGAVGG